MTPIEREELLPGNFRMLWWRATRGLSTETEIYTKRWQKFAMTFGGVGPDNVDHPGRHKLSDLLAQTPCRTSIWEIPKGRRKTPNESPLNCAVREFGEETGVSKNMYRLLFCPSINYSYTEGDVLYDINYFPALMSSDAVAHIRPQVHEVISAEWMDVRTIDAVAGKRMGRLARRIIQAVRRELNNDDSADFDDDE